MNKRTIMLLAVLCLVGSMVGCRLAKLVSVSPTPTQIAPPPTAAPTQVPPTAAAAAAPPTPTLRPQPTNTVAALPPPTNTAAPAPKPQAPALVAPPNRTRATLVDLIWKWDGELGPDDWFELQIWPDESMMTPPPAATATPGPHPVYAWLREYTIRITTANLMPGWYRWRVAVVRGNNKTRGQEVTPFSEEWTFQLVRPSTLGSHALTPWPSNTPTKTPTWVWWPTRTKTPTRTPTRTPTQVPVTPTNTGIPTIPTPTNTAVPTIPTATRTPIPTVPTPTRTPVPAYPSPTSPPAYPSPTSPSYPYPAKPKK